MLQNQNKISLLEYLKLFGLQLVSQVVILVWFVRRLLASRKYKSPYHASFEEESLYLFDLKFSQRMHCKKKNLKLAVE